MSDRAFFDTNICVYAMNETATKSFIARTMIQDGGVISVQVLNEYTLTARRKLKLDWAQIASDIFVLSQIADDIIPVSLEAHAQARSIAEQYNLQFYDSLLLASALEARCTRFLSEDMQHGLVIETLTIENPFRA